MANVGRGERLRLLREIGEISSMARAMASAAVGLKGWRAKVAMNEARRRVESERWLSVCEAANAKRERIIRKDAKQLDERVKALLSDESNMVSELASDESSKVIEATLTVESDGSITYE